MWAVGGLVIALIMLGLTRALSAVAVSNVPSATGMIVSVSLLVVAAVSGFLAGAAIFRRAGHTRDNLTLFSALSGGVAGAIIGCAYALAVTSAYLSTYAAWPQSITEQVLMILSFPAFAGVGLCIGALAGIALGFALGSVLRLATAVAG